MRFLLYSHDTYGLGHFRRSSLLAAGIVGARPDDQVLIVTGSPRTQSFGMPDRVDTVKLPTVTKNASGRYRSRKLDMGLPGLIRFRTSLIASTIECYQPDVVLVDHAPVGMGGELIPILEQIGHGGRRTRLVLGLRDIVDEVGRVEAAWHRDGTWEWLNCYDDILIYGDERVTTTATELGLAHRTTATTRYTGYVAPAMPEPKVDEPFLLVTTGGGGDGQALLRRYLDAVERGAARDIRSIVVTGPLLSSTRRAELLMRASRLPTVEVIEFTDRLRQLVSSAAGVVSMAGYNTVVELLAANTPALLVPRCAPRLEQHLRAVRLSSVVPNVEHCPIEMLDRHRLQAFTDRCRDTSSGHPELDLTGVSKSVEVLNGERSLTSAMKGTNHG